MWVECATDARVAVRHTVSRRFTQKAKRVFSKVTGFPSRKGPLSRQLYVWDLPDALCRST